MLQAVTPSDSNAGQKWRLTGSSSSDALQPLLKVASEESRMMVPELDAIRAGVPVELIALNENSSSTNNAQGSIGRSLCIHIHVQYIQFHVI